MSTAAGITVDDLANSQMEGAIEHADLRDELTDLRIRVAALEERLAEE